MRLSRLQKYILTKSFYSRDKMVGRRVFYGFYTVRELEKGRKRIHDTIHKSIVALVKKDLLVAHGWRTSKKWFIQKVHITSKGKMVIKELLRSLQGKLPIK